MKDPTLAAQKWAQNLARSGDAIRAGVQAVQESPAQGAIRAQQKLLNNFSDAVTSGRWARNLGKMSLSDWQTAMTTTGLARIQSGAQKGQQKYNQFAQAFYPIMDAASKTAKGMPNNSTEDALARVRVVIEAAKRFAGK